MRSRPSPSRSTEPCHRWVALALLAAAGTAGAQTLSNTSPLSFGAFTAGSGGTIVLSTAGARSKSGGVLLVSQGGAAAAAQFSVTGTASAVYTITLPVDGTVLLSDGSNSMALNGFASSPAGTGILSGGGTAVLSIGATLTVGNAQAPGSYTGSFNVTVNYQ